MELCYAPSQSLIFDYREPICWEAPVLASALRVLSTMATMVNILQVNCSCFDARDVTATMYTREHTSKDNYLLAKYTYSHNLAIFWCLKFDCFVHEACMPSHLRYVATARHGNWQTRRAKAGTEVTNSGERRQRQIAEHLRAARPENGQHSSVNPDLHAYDSKIP